MKFIKNKIAAGVVSALICSSAFAGATGGHSWGYEGEHGPAHWGELSHAYELCAKGVEQSPVDINNTIDSDELKNLKIKYKKTPLQVVNNGHTLKVPVADGAGKLNTRLYGDYKLLQFHFHAGSEHTVMGLQYPLEVHFVHGNDEGALAVVGVLFEEGAFNPTLQAILDNAPEHEGENHVDGAVIKPRKLLPENREYFHYSGSLTTPPCSEGVKWFVMKDTIEASAEQLEQFRHFYEGNFRPVQPINERVILEKED